MPKARRKSSLSPPLRAYSRIGKIQPHARQPASGRAGSGQRREGEAIVRAAVSRLKADLIELSALMTHHDGPYAGHGHLVKQRGLRGLNVMMVEGRGRLTGIRRKASGPTNSGPILPWTPIALPKPHRGTT